ncbi:MAG: hypothetical protein PHY42_01870 [Bacilli bacterium]|nr:hypothetical protein [Bacilli bacterium]
MKNMQKNWKKALRQECNTFVPDCKEEIMQTLGIPESPKTPLRAPSLRLVGIFTFLIAVIMMVVFTSTPIVQASSIVTVDINPSVEIEVDSFEKVKSIRAMNKDGALILLDSEEFLGLDIEDAIERIIQLAEEAGYLDLANQIEIVAMNQNVSIETKLKNRIGTYLEQYKSNHSLDATIKVNDANQETKNQADVYHISIGFMKLIEKARLQNPELTIEEAREMTPKELNEMAKAYRAEELAIFVETIRTQISNFKDKHDEAMMNAEDQYTMEAIQEKYKAQINAYKNELRETIRNQGRPEDVDFPFDDHFQSDDFPELPNDNRDIQEVFLLIIKIRTIIASHRGKWSERKINIVEALYDEYSEKLEQLPLIIQNGNQVKEFEAFYQEFLENLSN